MPAKVLDTSALIVYFRDELGGEAVEALLIGAAKRDSPLHMVDVNYSEVRYSISRREGVQAWAEVGKTLQGLPITFHSTSQALADSAADIKFRYRISLASAFAAAFAKSKRAELVTADAEFKALEKELKISWLK